MAKTRVGSLCTGIGGLDLAVNQIYGGETVWYSEVEPAPTKLLAQHLPGAPNLGDLTKTDWAETPSIDVLTAGYPCQPFSTAGKREGTNDERHLWPYIRDAVRVLRPARAVFENVAGHLTLGFDQVLGDLARLGYDAVWGTFRASTIGAPHRRARLFVVAWDASHQNGWDSGTSRNGGPSGPVGRPARHTMETGELLAAPTAQASGGSPERFLQRKIRAGVTPVVTGLRMQLQELGGPLLPTPRASMGASHTETRDVLGDGGGVPFDFGRYQPAIDRWANILGRSAPFPLAKPAGVKQPQLTVRFVEWMMGFDEGWVDGVPRTAGLKALGNAVVTRQALAAVGALEARIGGTRQSEGGQGDEL